MLVECLLLIVLYRIQYGFGHFSLGDNQDYYLVYEPSTFCLKIIVTQLKKIPQGEMEAFKLFVSLMIYIERSILSVMESYLPSAKQPVLHVWCPLCDSPDPHIIVKLDKICTLSISTLYCSRKNRKKELPTTSYLPFGDSLLGYQKTSKLVLVMENFCVF